jgi:aconitase A
VRPQNLVEKLIATHRVDGTAAAGQEIGLTVDQVLLTDTNGTMAWLQFEAMGFPRVTPTVVVTYADHNVYQVDSRNTDDHRYLGSVSRRYGGYYSKPGNGICHQVHLETFGAPGEVLLGSDSHTPLCGALGMLAIGAGGLDVACAMGGGAYYLPMPKVVRVVLAGRLRPWVAAKDIILELLRRLTVRGGFGKIFEYDGPGVATLTIPQRATIANMGAELGLTTSVFPSDDVTRAYLARLGREAEWKPLAPDRGARYDDTFELDLGRLEPLVALPGSPDHVVPVTEVEGRPSSRRSSAPARTGRGRTCTWSPRSSAAAASTPMCHSFSSRRASRSSRPWLARGSSPTSWRPARSSPSRPAGRVRGSGTCRPPGRRACERSTATFRGGAASRTTKCTFRRPRPRASRRCGA